MRRLLKACVNALFLVLAFPAALLSGFGRLKPVYTFFAHADATVPGGIGDFFRGVYYHLTLRQFEMLWPMTDVGSRTTIDAGSVVTRPVPGDCVAVGCPARVIGSAEATGAKPEMESLDS
jgi:hypothetical protein